MDERASIRTYFFAADCLGKGMSAEIGITYQNMVSKCLACDFGYGDDLGCPALQAAFHKNVVCELERLERRFGMLQIAD